MKKLNLSILAARFLLFITLIWMPLGLSSCKFDSEKSVSEQLESISKNDGEKLENGKDENEDDEADDFEEDEDSDNKIDKTDTAQNDASSSKTESNKNPQDDKTTNESAKPDQTENEDSTEQSSSNKKPTKVEITTNGVYTTGDIIYLDGSSSSPENYDKSKKAVAVVFFDANGNALGLSINKITQQKWAEKDSFGLNTKFEKICSYYDSTTSEISGDLDGSDNWEEISSTDKNGAESQAENYPGFSLVNNYAEKNNLIGTDFEDGWYATSLFELSAIYDSLEKLNSTLEKVTTKTNLLSTSKAGYWSASQNPDKATNVWFINFATGEIKSAKKTTKHGFRAIRKL